MRKKLFLLTIIFRKADGEGRMTDLLFKQILNKKIHNFADPVLNVYLHSGDSYGDLEADLQNINVEICKIKALDCLTV